jgi:hypothetical protein
VWLSALKVTDLWQHGPDALCGADAPEKLQYAGDPDDGPRRQRFLQTVHFSSAYWHRYVGKNSDPQEWYCTDNRDFVDPDTGKLEYDVKDKATSR